MGVGPPGEWSRGWGDPGSRNHHTQGPRLMEAPGPGREQGVAPPHASQAVRSHGPGPRLRGTERQAIAQQAASEGKPPFASDWR